MPNMPAGRGSAVRHPPAGFVRLSDPTLDSTCRAYERIGADVTDVQVLCQEANVVVGVALTGTPELAKPDVALHAANLIKKRVRGSNGSQTPSSSGVPKHDDQVLSESKSDSGSTDQRDAAE